jgi:hypothetical protein
MVTLPLTGSPELIQAENVIRTLLPLGVISLSPDALPLLETL